MKAVILEMLSEHQHSASKAELHNFVVNVLGEHSDTVSATLEPAIQSLVANGLVASYHDRYFLNDQAKQQLTQRVSATEQREKATLERLLREAAIRTTFPLTTPSTSLLQELVDQALVALGITIAEFFLYGRPADLANDELEKVINASAAAGLPRAQKNSYFDALRHFVIQPSSEDEDVVFNVFSRISSLPLSSLALLAKD